MISSHEDVALYWVWKCPHPPGEVPQCSWNVPFVAREKAPFVASLLLVVRPGAPSSVLAPFVAMPFAPFVASFRYAVGALKPFSSLQQLASTQ